MSNIIIGVVMDVLIHLVIHDLNRRGIGGIPATAWDFVILDAGINTLGGLSGLGRLLPVAVQLDGGLGAPAVLWYSPQRGVGRLIG